MVKSQKYLIFARSQHFARIASEHNVRTHARLVSRCASIYIYIYIWRSHFWSRATGTPITRATHGVGLHLMPPNGRSVVSLTVRHNVSPQRGQVHGSSSPSNTTHPPLRGASTTPHRPLPEARRPSQDTSAGRLSPDHIRRRR